MIQKFYGLVVAGLFVGLCSAHAMKASDSKQVDGKTLVVFSTRKKNPTGSSFFQAYWGEEKLDLSYSSRHDIVTLDMMPVANSALKDLHIVADATKPIVHIPNITSLYLERPYTTSKNDEESNLIQCYLTNILSVLPDNHPVMIEWDPCLKILHPSSDENPEKLRGWIEEQDIQNPFTGHWNGDVCVFATSYALGFSQLPLHITPDEQKLMNECKKQLKSLLSFIATNVSVAGSVLEKRLDLETKIIVLKEENYPCTVYTKKDLSLALETINDDVDFIVIEKDGQKGKKLMKGIHLKDNKIKLFKRELDLSNYTKFSQGATLFNFIWSNMTTITNRTKCMQCLEEKCGLYNVEVEQGISPVNGRRNVYFFSGLKKPQMPSDLSSSKRIEGFLKLMQDLSFKNDNDQDIKDDESN